jgi:hypothetical protein
MNNCVHIIIIKEGNLFISSTINSQTSLINNNTYDKFAASEAEALGRLGYGGNPK